MDQLVTSPLPQLLVALDVDRADRARALVDQLRGVAGGFKIGSRLFTAQGPSLVEDLAGKGHRIFLDLKFHDIPSTVAGAAAAATRLGVWMLNVHASGGSVMMRAARDAAAEEAARWSRPAPLVLAVTVLTSLGDAGLPEIGVPDSAAAHVDRLAALTHASGLDGVVASGREIAIVRRRCGSEFLVVTPGIRGATDPPTDQQRTLTAAEALDAGASYLVVGRPIIAAADPRLAAERMVAECRIARAS